MEEKRKVNPLIPVFAILLAALSFLCGFLWMEKSKAEKLAEDYKASYDELVEKTKKAKQAEEDAERKAKQDAEAYQEDYNLLVSHMLDDAVLAEKMGNLIIGVWHNAIWNTTDSETDKFTQVNGEFVSDFNDALGKLFDDEEFRKDVSSLTADQKQVKDEMKEMLNPPEGYENAFKALESVYNAYISFTNIVLHCEGSLESFSNDFGEADEDFVDLYRGAELYVK